jgi:hypothetical protein
MLRTFLRTNRLDFFAAQATRNIAYGEDAQWNTEFTDVRSPLLRVLCADLEGATALHLTAGLNGSNSERRVLQGASEVPFARHF